jgi:hypothetical protein
MSLLFHFSCFHNMQLCVLFPFQMARTKTCAAKVLVSQRHHPSSSTPPAPTDIPPSTKKSETFNKVRFPGYRCFKIYEKYHSNCLIHSKRKVSLPQLGAYTLDTQIEKRSWNSMCQDWPTATPNALIYSNFQNIKTTSLEFDVFLRKKMYHISPDVVASALKIPRVAHPGYPYTGKLVPLPDTMMELFCGKDY